MTQPNLLDLLTELLTFDEQRYSPTKPDGASPYLEMTVIPPHGPRTVVPVPNVLMACKAAREFLPPVFSHLSVRRREWRDVQRQWEPGSTLAADTDEGRVLFELRWAA